MKILVFDDSQIHRNAAIAQLGKDHDLTVVGTYDEAQGALTSNAKYDVVLTDLLVPASSQKLGSAGMHLAGAEMPLGTIISFLALRAGVKMVAVVTDANHHAHPASAALDTFYDDIFAVGDAKVVMANYDVTERLDAETFEVVEVDFLFSEEGKAKYPNFEGTVRVKNWAKFLNLLIS